MSRRPMRKAGGAFEGGHSALMGKPIDFARLDPATIPEAYREAAIAAWQERFETEYRSIQIMTRFMTEVVGAGDPIDVYAMVVDLIEDEVRHMALCGETVRALGRNAVRPSLWTSPSPRRSSRSPWPTAPWPRRCRCSPSMRP